MYNILLHGKKWVFLRKKKNPYSIRQWVEGLMLGRDFLEAREKWKD